MLRTQWTMFYNNNVQWTTMTMNNTNNNNIMATVTILNVTIHNESMTTMNHALNGLQWQCTMTMNNEQWTMITMTKNIRGIQGNVNPEIKSGIVGVFFI